MRVIGKLNRIITDFTLEIMKIHFAWCVPHKRPSESIYRKETWLKMSFIEIACINLRRRNKNKHTSNNKNSFFLKWSIVQCTQHDEFMWILFKCFGYFIILSINFNRNDFVRTRYLIWDICEFEVRKRFAIHKIYWADFKENTNLQYQSQSAHECISCDFFCSSCAHSNAYWANSVVCTQNNDVKPIISKATTTANG